MRKFLSEHWKGVLIGVASIIVFLCLASCQGLINSNGSTDCPIIIEREVK